MENCIVSYKRKENNVVHISRIMPKLDSNNENSYIGELIIPESIFIDGRKRKIVGVDQFAFFDCKLEKLTLPKSINIDNVLIDKGIEIIRK